MVADLAIALFLISYLAAIVILIITGHSLAAVLFVIIPLVLFGER